MRADTSRQWEAPVKHRLQLLLLRPLPRVTARVRRGDLCHCIVRSARFRPPGICPYAYTARPSVLKGMTLRVRRDGFREWKLLPPSQACRVKGRRRSRARGLQRLHACLSGLRPAPGGSQ